MGRFTRCGVIGVTATLCLAAASLLQRTAARPTPGVSCELKGKWLDESGYNFAFTTNRVGIWGWNAGVPGYAGCPAPWSISARRSVAYKINAKFQNTNTNGCGQSFKVNMHFSPDCRGASGRYTNADGGSGSEVWTRVE